MSDPKPAEPGSELKDDLSNWDPENPARWSSKRAWGTLWITTYTMFISFATWYVVSAIAPRLNDIGFALDSGQLYWLVAIPGLAAGLLRMVFMFLPPILGSRTLVVVSALLLLIPLLGWTFVVRDTSTPFWVLMALAFAAGIGGGTFSGFMPSTSYFFPKRLSGTALGLQAGLGNFGISFIQLITPWIVGFGLFGTAAIAPEVDVEGGYVWLHNGGLVLVPWVLLAAFLAFMFIRRVPVKANFREQLKIFGLKHTWIQTVLYVMGFGLFSGLGAQTGLLIGQLYGGFEGAPNALAFTFIGPAIGALVRAACGPLCDRWGGGIFTLVGAIGMFAGCIVTMFFLAPSDVGQFWGFLTGTLIIMFFSGLVNAGTFKQMPMIFPKLQAGGAIGWTASVAAFGPFFVGVLLSSIGVFPFYIWSAALCLVSVWLAWYYYVRPGAEARS
ncbi:MFS transporter [Agromyces archimandritae]|uniref:NarK/NasA family nitrate transporter n=1 Tax=Agromyces archimandritae TaxID=2781962 RepID=A0A975IMT0_9MICO|nr:MFS transporter [Agromyces archimandritae]QTX03862.1 NarK/NasA family nitrate transporter [Agromyces archimandritae]